MSFKEAVDYAKKLDWAVILYEMPRHEGHERTIEKIRNARRRESSWWKADLKTEVELARRTEYLLFHSDAGYGRKQRACTVVHVVAVSGRIDADMIKPA